MITKTCEKIDDLTQIFKNKKAVTGQKRLQSTISGSFIKTYKLVYTRCYCKSNFDFQGVFRTHLVPELAVLAQCLLNASTD